MVVEGKKNEMKKDRMKESKRARDKERERRLKGLEGPDYHISVVDLAFV